MAGMAREPVLVEECELDSEQRVAQRFSVLIRTAKLVGASGEYLCVLRDVSETGLKLRIFHPLPQERRMTIELGTGERYQLDRMWEKGDFAGFRFVDEVDVAALLSEDGPFRKRSIRLNIELPALIVSNGQKLAARVCDFSHIGARIECDSLLAIDQQVRLEVLSLPVVPAKVRWRNQPDYGVVFENTFRFEELARLAASLQQNGLAVSGGR